MSRCRKVNYADFKRAPVPANSGLICGSQVALDLDARQTKIDQLQPIRNDVYGGLAHDCKYIQQTMALHR